ncbi:hypothetical protein SALBM135S_07847 [Streptomyces alboniger]
MQTCLILHPHHHGTRSAFTAAQVEKVLRTQKLDLLSTLRRLCSGPADFPPFAPLTSDPHMDYELERVARTPSHLTNAQVRRISEEAPWGVSLLSRIKADGETYATRLALEIRTFWRTCLVDQWPNLAAQSMADVAHRANLMCTEGLGATLDALHPSIGYHKGDLRIDSRNTIDTADLTRITLCPSIATSHLTASLDPWDHREMVVTYPAKALGGPDTPERGPAEPLECVIGPSRSTLLQDLEIPRTTTELAGRQHMSLSTVSYHLKKLKQAGLVERTRIGRFVYYHLTTKAGRWTPQHHFPA